MSAVELQTMLVSALDEIKSTVSTFGAGECAIFKGKTVELPEQFELENSAKKFVNDLRSFTTVARPHFITENIREKFMKDKKSFVENEETARKTIVDALESLDFQAKIMKMKISSKEIFDNCRPFFSKQILANSKTGLLYKTAEIDLSNTISEHDYKSILLSIKHDILRDNRELPTEMMLSLFKIFPIVKRYQVVSTVIKLLNKYTAIQDTHVSSPIASKDEIIPVLARLSKEMNIELDLESYDGQQYMYYCENIFSDVFQSGDVKLPGGEAKYERLQHDLLYHLNTDRLEEVKPRKEIKEYIEMLLTGNVYSATEFVNMMLSSHSRLSDYPRDTATCALRLRFARCHKLIRELQENCNFLYKEEGDKYLNLFVHILSTTTTYALDKTMNDCDYDAVFEEALSLCTDYTRAKKRLINILQVIYENSEVDYVLDAQKQILNQQINCLEGPHKSFIHTFEIQVQCLDEFAALLETLYEIYVDNASKFPYAFCQEEVHCPPKIFESSKGVARLAKFVIELPRVVKEICETMSISHVIYSSYIELAVIKELRNEIKAFPVKSLDSSLLMTGISINADNNAEQLFTFPVVTSYDYISNFVESYEGKKKYDQAMKMRQIRKYCIRLIKILVKQSYFEKTLDQQLSKGNHKVSLLSEFTWNIEQNNIDAQMGKLARLFEKQRRYLILLKAAVRYNLFESDATFITSKFRGDGFFLTENETADQQQVEAMKNILSILFTRVEDPNNFRAPFNPYEHIDSDVGETCNILEEISVKAEIAFIVTLEKSLLSYATTPEPFEFERVNGKPLMSRGVVDFLVIPEIGDVLALKEDMKDLKQLLIFVAARLRLLHQSFFRNIIFKSRKRLTDSMSTKSVVPDFAIFSFIEKSVQTIPETRKVESIAQIALDTVDYTELSFAAGMASIIDECCDLQTHKDLLPSFKELILETEELTYEGSFLVTERYIPPYIFRYSRSLDEEGKPLISNIITIVRGRSDEISNNLPFNEAAKESSVYLLSSVRSLFAKFVLFRLQHNSDFIKLTPFQAIREITNEDYRQSADDYTKTIESEANRRSFKEGHQGTETAFLEALLCVTLERMEPRVLSQIIGNTQNMIDVIKQQVNEPFAETPSTLKPEVYSKKVRGNIRSTPYISSPVDSEKQFAAEMNYAIIKILREVCESTEREPKDSSGYLVIDAERLENSLLSVSPEVDFLFDKSTDSVVDTWTGYINNTADVMDKSEELGKILAVYEKTIHERMIDELNVQAGEALKDKIMTLNAMRGLERSQQKAHKRFVKEYSKEVKEEYETLEADLHAEVELRKAKYKDTHDNFYKAIQKTISKTASKSIQDSIDLKPIFKRDQYKELFTEDGTPIPQEYKPQEEENKAQKEEAKEAQNVPVPVPPAAEPSESGFRRQIKPPTQVSEGVGGAGIRTKISETKKHSQGAFQVDEGQITSMNEEIDKLRKLILKERISRSLLTISIQRKYTREIEKAENERKRESMLLWTGRRSAEVRQKQMEADLQDGYKRLAELSDSLDTIKIEHDDVHKENIQLHHTKDMMLARIERAHQELKKLTNDADISVADLIKKIEEKQDELDYLTAETDALEEEIEYTVREPMREASRIKKRTLELKLGNTSMMMNKMKTQNELNDITRIIQENEKLKADNEKMRQAIKEAGEKDNISATVNEEPKTARVSIPSLAIPTKKIVKPIHVSARNSGVLRFKK